MLETQPPRVRVRGEQRHARACGDGDQIEAVPVDQAQLDQGADELGAAVGDDLAARLGLQPAYLLRGVTAGDPSSGQEASRSVRENTTLAMAFIGAALTCELFGLVPPSVSGAVPPSRLKDDGAAGNSPSTSSWLCSRIRA